MTRGREYLRRVEVWAREQWSRVLLWRRDGRSALRFVGIALFVTLAVLAVHALRRATDARSAPPRLAGEDPTIEILLTALEGSQRTQVTCESGWRAADEANAEIARAGEGAAASVSLGAAGKLVFCGVELGASSITVESLGAAPLRVGKANYRGRIRIRPKGTALRVTNIVGLEAYLASVVGSEMYASSTPAAGLEAQAVAARSYARFEIEKRGRTPLPDGQEAQAYYGVDRETPGTRAAVNATRHLVLRYDGDTLPAFYHSTCGGGTIDGSELLGSPAPPPLRGTACGFCEAAKYYRWNVGIPPAALAGLAADLRIGARCVRLEPLGVESDPWSTLRVTGTTRAVKVAARELRSALQKAKIGPMIPSPFFEEISGDAKGGIAVRGYGFGHGVGLCQMGAAEMARRGFAFREILAHYYPGADLVSTSPAPAVAFR